MSTIRRIGSALVVAAVAVSVLGSSPAAHAKDTSWGYARTSPTPVIADPEPEPTPTLMMSRKDTSWG